MGTGDGCQWRQRTEAGIQQGCWSISSVGLVPDRTSAMERGHKDGFNLRNSSSFREMWRLRWQRLCVPQGIIRRQLPQRELGIPCSHPRLHSQLPSTDGMLGLFVHPSLRPKSTVSLFPGASPAAGWQLLQRPRSVHSCGPESDDMGQKVRRVNTRWSHRKAKRCGLMGPLLSPQVSMDLH